MKHKSFKLGELFCGPGGLAYGALQAQSDDGKFTVEHAWANDYDSDTCDTYRKNICPSDPDSVHCCDVRDLDISKLGQIDAFCYGFPCNSFSNVGEHKGFENEKFGQLYWYGIEVLKTYQPQWFVAENVSGIRSAGSGDFEIILNDMREAGYKLNVNLYKAEQYGIPQTRHRVIIVGIRNDIPIEYKVPDPAMYSDCDVSAKTALSQIAEGSPNNEIRTLNNDVVRRLSYILPGENVWQAEERLGNQFPEDLKIKTRTKISQIYRKLDPNKPAYTVTAAGGGGTFMYHWTDRELTNRERAKLQTFPDDFEFVGNYSSVRKQIGMAVPCKLSEIVITAILNSFAGIKYPYVEANLEENMSSEATFNNSTFFTSSFDEPVLYAPARTERYLPCNSLKIITAFTDCDRISTHMIALSEGMKTGRFVKNLSVEIILGMTKSSLSKKKHEDICRLIGFLNGSKGMPKISCRYIVQGPEVHSKIYLWEGIDKKPQIAYCGSLNYTMNAYYKRRESVSICDALAARKYYDELLNDTIDCFDSQVSEKLKNVINHSSDAYEEPDNSEKDYLLYDSETPVDVLKVSLLRADGTDTGYGSGINWGIRKNGTKRDPNQAYIPYNRNDKKPGFFPDRTNPEDENCPMFKVITKDFGAFHMRMAQQNNKALHSVESNSILGEWIRKRIGAPSGGYVTKKMLELYGSTAVTFRKYEDGTYLLDF